VGTTDAGAFCDGFVLTDGTELGLTAGLPLELGCGAVWPTPPGVALCVGVGPTVGVTVLLVL
jgi:hypothetical protein